jgi:MFS family permease
MAPAEVVSKSGATHHDDVAEARKLGIEVDEVVVNRITEEDLMRISADSLTLRSKAGLRILLILFVMGVNQAGYGVDWGVIGGINSFQRWHDYYGFSSAGVIIGTLNGLMQIGTFVGAPFLALSDVIGRRGVNFLGNAIVIVAALMQGLAPNLPCLMIGRFVLGFGTALCTAPQYMAEIAPVHLRGRLVGFFGAFFQVGSLSMIGVMMGLSLWDTDWQWRLAFILQSIFPLTVCLTIYLLCPESPRYLVLKGKVDAANRVVTKYHTTSGDINEPIVSLVIGQIEETLELSKVGVRASYDYRVFFTKAVRFRTVLLVVYAIFQQWNGRQPLHHSHCAVS